MKKIYSNVDLKDITTSDIELASISWVENGRDLILCFNTNGSKSCSFTCTWANNIKIALKTNPNEGGYLLTWDITLKETENKEFEIQFDFATKGNISLRCNELIYNTKI